jgi:hypothetical protein
MRRDVVSLPALLILLGSCVFIFILFLSAYFEPDIRWLHFFQSWMYLTTILLSFRKSRWGYFIGVSAAGLWDYINLFVTTFFINGLHWLGEEFAGGKWDHIDQIIAVPAWIGNLLVVVGCVWGYASLPEKRIIDFVRVAAVFVLTTAFFALIIALCQPRYLPLFRGIFHPHLP